MSLSDLIADTLVILPVVVLMAWACVLLLVDLAIPDNRKGVTASPGSAWPLDFNGARNRSHRQH